MRQADTGTVRRKRRAMRTALLILPASALAAFVVVGGTGILVIQSIGLLPLDGRPTLSLAAFLANVSDLPQSIGLSLAIAASSTAIACLIGFGATMVVLGGRWTGRFVGWIGTMAIPIPHLVGAATIGLLLSDGGILARLFQAPTGQWPSFVGGPWWVAVVLEYGWKESAFVALLLVGTLAGRVDGYRETAALLGAGRRARLRHVVLPLAAPVLIVSGAIVFVFTLGSYEVAWLLGRPYPEPLAVMAVRLFGSVTLASRPEAAAIAVVTIMLSVLTAVAAFRWLRRVGMWR